MKPVTPELLRRYAAGTLSDADQHRVERAALDDPFVADALDGFLAMTGQSVPLEELQARLERRTRPNRRLGIWVPLTAAAGLGGMLFLGYSLFFKAQVPVASEMAKHAAPAARQDSAAPAPTPPPVQQPSMSLVPPRTTQAAPAGGAKMYTQEEADKVAPNVRAFSAAPDVADRDNYSLAAPAAAPAAAPPADTTVHREMLAKRSISASAPQKTDSSKVVSTIRIAGVNRPANDAVLDSTLRSEMAKGKFTLPFLDASPVVGRAAYQQYLQQQARRPADTGKTGIVRVQFRVNADSTLSRFRVLKGLGEPYDDEALRLVREGPRWYPALRRGKPVSRKVQVDVSF